MKEQAFEDNKSMEPEEERKVIMPDGQIVSYEEFLELQKNGR